MSSRPQGLPEIWDGRSMKDFHEARMSDYPEYPPFPGASLDRWLTTPPPEDDPEPDEPPETRECEGCGQQKPIEQMSTVFLPGTGETYQCSECRGGP